MTQQAALALKFKPIHEYAPMLLNALQTPVRTSFRRWSFGGVVQYDLFVQRESIDANYLLAVSYQPVPIAADRRIINSADPRLMSVPTDQMPSDVKAVSRQVTDWDGWRNIVLADAQAKVRLLRDQRRIAAANEEIESDNARVFSTLETATDETISRTPAEWWDWWHEYNEVREYDTPRPTYYDYRWFAPTINVGGGWFYNKVTGQPFRPVSCFPAGTPVWTETGIKSIESVQPGDRVLSKDPDTGELTFKVVIQRTVRPPNAIVGVRVNDETIYATKGHPFWVNGDGWRMAKQLEPGQAVHTLEGAGQVEEVTEQNFKAEAYNLVVADFGTYFVGKEGVLVHDNTYRSPTTAVVPGLIPAQRETGSAMARQ